MRESKVTKPGRLKAIWRAAFGLMDTALPTPPGGVTATMTSSAGKLVDASSALELSTVWACVRLLSETVATLPLILYRSDASENRRVAKDHPLYALLHDRPHYDWTAVEFWEGVVLSLALWGNAYARKEYMGSRLVSLTPLRCDRMVVARLQSGEREYRYAASTGLKRYAEEEIFHVRGFGGTGDVGLSPISFARQSIGAALAADEFASSMFKNGARPNGILTVDQVLSKEQREQVRENIVAPFVGSQNAGGLMVLEGAMKYQPVTMTPEDAQFLQTRGFNVEEICRFFRVPPFMVGHTEKTTSWGTGLEQQMTGFVTFALRPYLMRIEQSIQRSLIDPAERGNLKAEFKVEGLLRGDSQARSAFYSQMVRDGIMTRNEARRLENLEPLPGGDALTVQQQNVPLGQTPPPGPKGGAQ